MELNARFKVLKRNVQTKLKIPVRWYPAVGNGVRAAFKSFKGSYGAHSTSVSRRSGTFSNHHIFINPLQCYSNPGLALLVLAHEVGHSVRHTTGTGRKRRFQKRGAKTEFHMEELVAEIVSTMIAKRYGVDEGTIDRYTWDSISEHAIGASKGIRIDPYACIDLATCEAIVTMEYLDMKGVL